MDIDSEVGEGFNDFDVVTGNWHREPGRKEVSVVWILVFIQLTWRPRD